eukprot:GHVQ01030064.1.p1 GENE.GHVQ01030064.1~~GHVQ01030064.1.p1  ORF type:complete len:644 (+),score=142.93 GHVQ01030064.1:175-1932(+)
MQKIVETMASGSVTSANVDTATEEQTKDDYENKTEEQKEADRQQKEQIAQIRAWLSRGRTEDVEEDNIDQAQTEQARIDEAPPVDPMQKIVETTASGNVKSAEKNIGREGQGQIMEGMDAGTDGSITSKEQKRFPSLEFRNSFGSEESEEECRFDSPLMSPTIYVKGAFGTKTRVEDLDPDICNAAELLANQQLATQEPPQTPTYGNVYSEALVVDEEVTDRMSLQYKQYPPQDTHPEGVVGERLEPDFHLSVADSDEFVCLSDSQWKNYQETKTRDKVHPLEEHPLEGDRVWPILHENFDMVLGNMSAPSEPQTSERPETCEAEKIAQPRGVCRLVGLQAACGAFQLEGSEAPLMRRDGRKSDDEIQKLFAMAQAKKTQLTEEERNAEEGIPDESAKDPALVSSPVDGPQEGLRLSPCSHNPTSSDSSPISSEPSTASTHQSSPGGPNRRDHLERRIEEIKRRHGLPDTSRPAVDWAGLMEKIGDRRSDEVEGGGNEHTCMSHEEGCSDGDGPALPLPTGLSESESSVKGLGVEEQGYVEDSVGFLSTDKRSPSLITHPCTPCCPCPVVVGRTPLLSCTFLVVQ